MNRINPDTVQIIRHCIRALLQGLAKHGILNELELATALESVASELRIEAAAKHDRTASTD